MFVRPLSAVGSAQTRAVSIVWRPWHQPRCPWWTAQSLPKQPQYPTTSKKHSTFSWNEWRHPGVLPSSVPRGGLQFSTGQMECSDKGPPPKRRKSTEDKGAGGQVRWQQSPKSTYPRENREQGPVWLRNVVGVPLTPGKFPPSQENTVTKAGEISYRLANFRAELLNSCQFIRLTYSLYSLAILSGTYRIHYMAKHMWTPHLVIWLNIFWVQMISHTHCLQVYTNKPCSLHRQTLAGEGNHTFRRLIKCLWKSTDELSVGSSGVMNHTSLSSSLMDWGLKAATRKIIVTLPA